MDSPVKKTQEILYCSQVGNGPIFGSAPEATCWLLLEYRGPWGPKVLPYSSLSREVKDFLQHLTDTVTGLKVLFIKKPERRLEANLKLFLFSNKKAPRIKRHDLVTHDDLLNLDLATFFSDESENDPTLTDLFLVCTNGKRDRCCAKFGIPVYNLLCNNYGEDVWQCSHFGGHKYAPTFMHFPSGECYGRVNMKNTLSAAEAILSGKILPEVYRGPAGQPKPVQAAEYFLRNKLVNFQGNAVEVVRFAMDEASNTVALLKVADTHYEVSIETQTGPKEWSGCNKSEPTATKQFKLISVLKTNSDHTKEAI